VLVGGSAPALYAGHRDSYDHDHVLTDLRSRFTTIEEALAREPGWVLNRRAAGKIILGSLGGIETGLRQLIRRRPLEVQQMVLPSGDAVTVPTLAEIGRIKAYLIVKRNQVRDYLDVAALATEQGMDECARTLSRIDDYYDDDTRPPEDAAVRTQLVTQLADPRPKDWPTTLQLASYKGLAPEWTTWPHVVEVCQDLAIRIAKESADDADV
jgi:hypothetical protein